MKQILLSVVFLLRMLYATAQENKVTVAVAANMQYAANKLKEKFEQETSIKIEIILGSSGKLTQQIMEGAPYDIFISADTKYPSELYKNKFTSDTPRVYAKGLLVLWTNKEGIEWPGIRSPCNVSQIK